MEILIVGAGIGGMALAALLRQRGIGCVVIDRAADFSRKGYALSLYPMGSRVLHGLGVFEEFRKRSSPFHSYEVHNGSGDLLHRFDMKPVSEEFGYTGQILREELIEILRSAAPDVPLRMGLGLEHLDQGSEKVRVRFSDGTKSAFDGVIGADGIHSKTRRIVFGDEPDEETGWGLWAWWTDCELPRDTVQEFWGRGRFLGAYPTPTLIGAVAAGPRDLLSPETIGTNGLRVRELFSSMGGAAAEVVAGFPANAEGLSYWNFHDHRTRRWVHQRVALLGDATCAFLPTAGVGASMAMESAAVLADELSRTDGTYLPHSLQLYEKRRRHRVEAAQDDSRKLAAWMATELVPLVWTRDHFMKTATAETLVQSIAASLKDPI
jgi:2-polyprenyl-6-methoxyphenol hydroxylase-like FAD-dependent oxidoreductase